MMNTTTELIVQYSVSLSCYVEIIKRQTAGLYQICFLVLFGAAHARCCECETGTLAVSANQSGCDETTAAAAAGQRGRSYLPEGASSCQEGALGRLLLGSRFQELSTDLLGSLLQDL